MASREPWFESWVGLETKSQSFSLSHLQAAGISTPSSVLICSTLLFQTNRSTVLDRSARAAPKLFEYKQTPDVSAPTKC
jgi:hypothetical protein